ncbi:H-NS histone family protein [Dechloromonas sp. ZY10]|uniref:H-NS histone family protein n=1 Tax=Dechloromonas aquae TaxID=2664436 RepID=UPI003529CE63
MDLTTLSTVALRDLLQQIPAELKRREAQEKAAILEELRALAKARGYQMEELVGKEVVKPKAVAGIKVRVKYRHPQNAELQWTGRGRMPKWVEAWQSAGGTLEQLLV